MIAAALLPLAAFGSPVASRAAPMAPHIVIAGEAEAVFDWARDSCEPHDFPDAPARAFRAPDGTIRLFAPHHVARAMSGRHRARQEGRRVRQEWGRQC